MYKYSEKQGSKDPFFYFLTKNRLTYYVAFRNISQDNYPLNNLYSLDFGEIDNKKSENDLTISSTILEIIIQFLNKDNTCIIHYLCDNTDKKQLYRKKIFSRWFAISNMPNWTKYDFDFDNAEYNLSFLYNSEIYSTQLIEAEILLTLDVLERAKNK